MSKEEVKEKTEKEEIKVIDSKVLAFSIGVVALLAIVVCVILSIAVHTASSLYIEKSQEVVQQEKTISTLQRALDYAGGKLDVYETYLTNRNIDIVRNLLAKFLKEGHKSSAKATIKQFEGWMGKGCSVCPDHVGTGGR